jgi:thiol-disulfide isomerase/thioredoxin
MREVELFYCNKSLNTIVFWASWCGPCLQEMPQWSTLYGKSKRNELEILGIALERTDKPDIVRRTIRKKHLRWSTIIDVNRAESRKLGIKSFPFNILLDRNGVIIQKNITPELLNEEFGKHTIKVP